MASAVIGALRVNLSIDTAAFQRGMTAAEKMAYKFGTAIGGFLKNQLTSLNGALIAVAGPAALGLLIKSSIDATSAQVDLANRVGASVGAIQTLEYATSLSGGSVEGLAKALGILNVKLDQAAREGAGPAYEALQRLGLAARDIAQLDADEKIKLISDRMSELNLSTQAQASILRDLGVKQQEMINLFQEGSSAINEAREELSGWGVLLSDVDAAKIEAAGDAWDKIKTILMGVGNQLAIRLAPLITSFAEWLGQAAKETGGFGDAMDKAILMGIQLFVKLNEELYLARVAIDTLAGGFLDLFDTVAGAPANLLATIFGGEASDYGFEPINKSYGKLKENLEKPASFEEWRDWYRQQKLEMDELAKKSAAAMKNTGLSAGLGEDGESEVERKSRERIEKQMEERLARLQESLMTEREAEQAAYEQRLADLAAFQEAQLLSTQEAADLRARIEADHAAQVKRIEDDIAADRERNAKRQMDTYFDIADNISSALGSLFGDSKGWAIAEAIINTATGITKALAVYGPTPQGWAAAAAAAAAGIAQLATIRKTSSSSKGGGSNPSVRGSSSSTSSSSSNSSSGSASAGKDQTLFVRGIDPSQMFSGDVVRNLAQVLIDYQRDGGRIVLASK